MTAAHVTPLSDQVLAEQGEVRNVKRPTNERLHVYDHPRKRENEPVEFYIQEFFPSNDINQLCNSAR